MQVEGSNTPKRSVGLTLISWMLLLHTYCGKCSQHIGASLESSFANAEDQQSRSPSSRQQDLENLFSHIKANEFHLPKQHIFPFKEGSSISTPLFDISITGPSAHEREETDTYVETSSKEDGESPCYGDSPDNQGDSEQHKSWTSEFVSLALKQVHMLDTHKNSAITAAMYLKYGDHTDHPSPMAIFSKNQTTLQGSDLLAAESHISEFWGLVERRQSIPCNGMPYTCGNSSVSRLGSALTLRQFRNSSRYVPRNESLFGVELRATGRCPANGNTSEDSWTLGLLAWNGTTSFEPQVQAPPIPFSILLEPAVILKGALAATFQVDFLNGTMPTVRLPISCSNMVVHGTYMPLTMTPCLSNIDCKAPRIAVSCSKILLCMPVISSVSISDMLRIQ